MSLDLNSTSRSRIALTEYKKGGLNSSLSIIDDQKCPFTCRFTSITQDEIECLNTVIQKVVNISKSIQCKLIRGTMRYVIGNRTSVRRIVPAGLRVLSTGQNVKLSTRGNLLDIYLYMNILDLEADALIGLENSLHKIQIFNVHRLHPDTFLKAKRLSTIIIDSSTVPAMTPNLFSGDDSTKNISISRTFIRLLPEDDSYPLATNIDVRCHKCTYLENVSDFSIVTFSTENNFHSDKSVIDSLSLTYLDSCHRMVNGLGCREVYFDKNNESILVSNSSDLYILKPSAPNGWDDAFFPSIQSVYNKYSELRINYLVTSLIIWCSVISVILLSLFLWIIIRRSRNQTTTKWTNSTTFNNKPTNVLLRRIVNQSGSREDLTNTRTTLECNGNLAYDTPSTNSHILPCSGRRQFWDTSSRDLDNMMDSIECKAEIFQSAPTSHHGDGNNPDWRLSEDYTPNHTPSLWNKQSNGDLDRCVPNGDSNGLPSSKVIDNGSAFTSNDKYFTTKTPCYKRSKDGIFQLTR